MIVWRHGCGVKGGLGTAIVCSLLLCGEAAWAEAVPGPLTAMLSGVRAVARGDINAANQSLEAVPESQRSAELTASLGLMRLLRGQEAKAHSLLKRATDVAPTLAEAHYWLAIASLRQGHVTEATKSFDIAVSLAADQPGYRLARGLALAAVGRQREALDDVVEAAKREPNILVPSYHPDERRGMIAIAERGLRQHPQKGLVDEALALLAYDCGLMMEARRRSSAVKTAGAMEVMGRLALDRGEAEKAMGLLGRAMAERPRSARIRFHFARAAFQRGSLERARAALQEATRLDPGDARVHTALADLHLRQGDLERAELAYGYALSRTLDAHALAGIGRALELQGDLDGALRNYRKAVALAPAAIESLERLARLLERRDASDAQAKSLRRRLKAATKLEEDVAEGVEVRRKATLSHAQTCALIDGDPEAALQRLKAKNGVGPAAIAFARVAAFTRGGQLKQARAQANAVLTLLPARRWSKGARPFLEIRRKIGPALVIRRVPFEYVRLD